MRMNSDSEFNRKRKNNQLASRRFPDLDGENEPDHHHLALSLSICPAPQDPRQSELLSAKSLSSQPRKLVVPPRRRRAAPRGRGGRHPPPPDGGGDGGECIPAPFPWATTRRATVQSMGHLLANRIESIAGVVQCRRCERVFEIEYDLRQKFLEVGAFIVENKGIMHDRAPEEWTSPVLPRCGSCGQENAARPVIVGRDGINWLFLLLGQMLGCCTLEQLKYFCEHTGNHRTGAKDRLLYYTYLGLCKQLDPTGPFDP
ncbi:uncharacterized protein LOC115735626 [Rhodamnia argentea]|uniref:Uncharacterized protein LOC115735626 n=1 Tax=Rhodamnia argentea TaxID=178133 RepID=A0A8B8NL38_9MYRT|nr:uncharacterized protein LOC115735626 [Rhodamnia argentea]